MSYRLIDANALNGVISNDDYEKVLNAPCIFADLPNGLDGEHYNLQEPIEVEAAQLQKAYNKGFEDCRQAVLDVVNNPLNIRLDEIIKQLPSVKPQEPKTGHWINISNKDLHDYRTGNKLCFECSECRSQYTYKFNYCPNCGMIEPQERSE